MYLRRIQFQTIFEKIFLQNYVLNRLPNVFRQIFRTCYLSFFHSRRNEIFLKIVPSEQEKNPFFKKKEKLAPITMRKPLILGAMWNRS